MTFNSADRPRPLTPVGGFAPGFAPASYRQSPARDYQFLAYLFVASVLFAGCVTVLSSAFEHVAFPPALDRVAYHQESEAFAVCMVAGVCR